MVATAANSATICGKPLAVATTWTATLLGLEPQLIRVEVCSTRGPAFFQMVGLAETAVREARVRVASALASLGVLIDEYAITVNLAPAGVRKSGTALDLAIAIAVLGAVGRIPPEKLRSLLLLGELSLEGELRSVRGVLPLIGGLKSDLISEAVVPFDNGREAGLVPSIPTGVAKKLSEVIDHLQGHRPLARAAQVVFSSQPSVGEFVDLAQIRGQQSARRALEIAAAGGHNLLLIGPPGTGKTLLARTLPGILPPLSYEEAIETTKIHSVAGLVDSHAGIVNRRPFRAPHHSVSEAGLVGGGELPRPGEVSLAHNGVLFLDELAEFRRAALESLRQPLEDGSVCIARARARAFFPARPVVVAAVNPCACGYRGHPRRNCRCTDHQRRRYLSRLSGPLLDRIDVHVAVPPLQAADWEARTTAEDSTTVRARVERARQEQQERFQAGAVSGSCNAALSNRDLDRSAQATHEAKTLLNAAIEQLSLSARSTVRVLRVARTIADLEGSSRVRPEHVAEALQGRVLDQELFR